MGQKVKLSDLFQIGSSKRVLKAQWQKAGVPFYRGREITKLSQLGFVDNELFITEELYAEYAYKYGVPTAGDIVITAIGTIGNSYIVSEGDRFYFKDASVLWLKKASEVDSKYINLWLKSPLMKNQLDEGNGATVDTLTIKKLQSLVVDLPPIPEQKRIVAILDQAFADIEQARAKTEQNLKNARELFESYLQQVFSQRGEGWIETTLENLVTDDCSLSYGIVQPGEDVNGGIAVVRPTDMKKELINLDGLKLIDPVKAEGYQRTSLKGGELLVCVRGTTGVTSIACESLAGANVTRGIVPVRFDSLKITDRFGYYQFISPLIQTQIKAATYGAALMQINIRDFKKITLSVPSLEIQTKIATKLDEIAPELKKVERIYFSKISALDELKKSILQKAFSGELTKTLEGEASKGVVA